MPYLFKPIQTQLTAQECSVTIEPLFSVYIDPNGWHARGVYRICQGEKAIGFLYFEGNQWRFEGTSLTETAQEELAYFIRFYDGKAA